MELRPAQAGGAGEEVALSSDLTPRWPGTGASRIQDGGEEWALRDDLLEEALNVS